jgi:hypothetical protein
MDAAVRGGDEKLEVLLYPEHHGRIFVRGIFVMIVPSEKLRVCGLNFIGSPAKYDDLGYGRDRDSIDVYRLCHWFLRDAVVAVSKTRNEFFQRVIAMLYEELQQNSESYITGMLRYYLHLDNIKGNESYVQARDKLLPSLLEEFRRRHSPAPVYAVPVDEKLPASERENMEKEAQFLQATLISVSRVLLEVLQDSPDCPSLQMCWRMRQDHIFDVPDWLPPDESARAFAGKFELHAHELYSDLLRGPFRHKQFPEGQHAVEGCVVMTARVPEHADPVRVQASGLQAGQYFYATDMTLLMDHGATHDWMWAVYGTRCISPAGDQCKGACSMMRFGESLLAQIKMSSGLSGKELEKRMKIQMIRHMAHDLPNVTVLKAASPAPAQITPATAGETVELEAGDNHAALPAGGFTFQLDEDDMSVGGGSTGGGKSVGGQRVSGVESGGGGVADITAGVTKLHTQQGVAPAPTDKEPDIATLTIAKLKEIITSAGLTTQNCIEKNDLQARAREALRKLAKEKSAPTVSPTGTPGGQAASVGSLDYSESEKLARQIAAANHQWRNGLGNAIPQAAFSKDVEDPASSCLQEHSALVLMAVCTGAGGGQIFADAASSAYLAGGMPQASQSALMTLRQAMTSAKMIASRALPSLTRMIDQAVSEGFDGANETYYGFCTRRGIVINLCPLLRQQERSGSAPPQLSVMYEILLTILHELAHLLDHGGGHGVGWRSTQKQLHHAVISSMAPGLDKQGFALCQQCTPCD